MKAAHDRLVGFYATWFMVFAPLLMPQRREGVENHNFFEIGFLILPARPHLT